MGFRFVQRRAVSLINPRRGQINRRARFGQNVQKFENRVMEQAMNASSWDQEHKFQAFDVSSMRRDAAKRRNHTLSDSQKHLREVKQFARTQRNDKRLQENFRSNFPMLPLPKR